MRTFMIGIGFAGLSSSRFIFRKGGVFARLSKFKEVRKSGISHLGSSMQPSGGLLREFMFADSQQGLPCCSVEAALLDRRLLGARRAFGAAHAYQNPLGIGSRHPGFLMDCCSRVGSQSLACDHGHGLFDASRFVLFYFKGRDWLSCFSPAVLRLAGVTATGDSVPRYLSDQQARIES